jgi:hypothetical protein
MVLASQDMRNGGRAIRTWSHYRRALELELGGSMRLGVSGDGSHHRLRLGGGDAYGDEDRD